MGKITIEEVKKELENFRNNTYICNGCYSIQENEGFCDHCGGKKTTFNIKEIAEDSFYSIAELCIEQDEKIQELTKKLNEAKSLLINHHEDRHENDHYYDGEYDLFNETVDFVK